MKKKVTLWAMLPLLVALGFLVAHVALAIGPPPGLPHQFWGAVIIEGEPAVGAVVSAEINGFPYATGVTDAEGRYGYDALFTIPSDDVETPEKDGGVWGDVVVFKVNGDPADTDPAGPIEFESGGRFAVNLSIGEAPEPTPTPTATVEPTPTATVGPTPTATVEPTPTATVEPMPTPTREPTTLQSIAVTPESSSMRPGRTRQFEATASYSDGSSAPVTAYATWESSDQAVATIDTEVDHGLATSLTVGTTTITAIFQGVSDSATLRVLLPRPPSPTPTPTRIPPDQQVIIEAPEGGVAEVVEPGQSTQVSTPDGGVVLDIPWAFVEEPTQVVVAPIDPSEAPAPTAGRQVLCALSITAYDLRGNEITVVSGMPAQLTVSYTDDDLQLVGGDPTRLLVMRYVPGRGWATLVTTVDTERRLLTVNINTFSMFALGGQMTPGDINVDGVVNYFDLAILGASYGSSWGDPLYRPEADLNGDRSIDLLDLAILAANYATTGR